MPIDRWSKISENGLQFALQVSPDVVAVHVEVDEERKNNLLVNWEKLVVKPLANAGRPIPKLIILPSPYRVYLRLLLDFVLNLEHENPDRVIAVVIPELVQSSWYQYLLHNKRADSLKNLLLRKGDRRIVVINVPWYLS